MTTGVAAEIKVGDPAPDFSLKDQDQKEVKLSDFRGKKHVCLAFYPLDWSPVCTGENKCLTDDFPSFQSSNAEVVGISTDSFFRSEGTRLNSSHQSTSRMPSSA